MKESDDLLENRSWQNFLASLIMILEIPSMASLYTGHNQAIILLGVCILP